MTMKIAVGLVDDHHLFRKALSMMVQSFVGFEVVVDAENGKDLQEKLNGQTVIPQIMLLDVEMPVLNGRDTARWLRQQYPAMKLVALSMNDQETIVLEMIRAGCCSYLLKDITPEVLEQALTEVYHKNYYNSDLKQNNLATLMLNPVAATLTDKEREFLQWACSDLTYRQIAGRMKVSERTVDGYRESLFEKFNVGSRTGLALEAVRRGIVKL